MNASLVFAILNWRPTMASAKTKNDTRLPTLKVLKNGPSKDSQSEEKDLWLGMERRKFSYTFHIPERRSHQNRKMPESTIQNAKHHTKG
jgi:hypothetical protein